MKTSVETEISIMDSQSDIQTEIKNIVKARAVQCSNSILASQLQKALPEITNIEQRGSLHVALQEMSQESLMKLSSAKNMSQTSFLLPRKSVHTSEVTLEEYVAPENKNELLTDKFVRHLPVPIKEKRYYSFYICNIIYFMVISYRRSIVSTFRRKPWYTELHDLIKRNWKNFISRFYIWQDSLKIIEGRHGSAVVAYFVFIRWLLFMNLIMFLLNFFFLLIPQSVCSDSLHSTEEFNDTSFTHESSKLSSKTIKQASLQENNSEYNVQNVINFVFVNESENSTHFPIEKVIAYCKKLYKEQLANNTRTGFIAFFQNLLQGTGPLESTHLFLGSYNDACHGYVPYSIASAFLFVLFASLLFCFILMIMFSTVGIQETFLVQYKRSNYYSNEVFSAWNFSIDNPKSASYQHNKFFLGIKNSLSDDLQKKEISARSAFDWAKLYAIRFIVNVFIIIWLWTCFFLIYKVAVYQLQEQQKYYSTELGLRAFFLQFITSIVLVIFNGVSPVVFSFLVQFEKYSAINETNISLFRNIFLSLSSFMVLLNTLYRQIACEEKDICGAGNSLSCNIPRCWETYIGQLLYKLCIIDFSVYIGLFLGYDCVQNYVSQNFDNKFTKLWSRPTFYLPTEALAPIFSQTIVWFGLFYSPLLPAITVVKLIVVFYMKRTKVLYFCDKPEIMYRASRFNAMFITLLFISYFIIIIVLGFEIDRIQPSRGCGPFRHYLSMGEALPMFLRKWLSFLTSYWSTSFMSIMLCLMIHYYWRISASQKELAKRLRAQVVLHTHDKQYLLASIAQLTGGQKS